MKKILALLLALAMLVTVTPVFAEETDAAVGSDGTTEEVTYDSLADQYDAEVGNFTRIKTSWKVTGGAVSPMSGNSMSTYTKSKGNFAILKVDLPSLGNGQKYGKMIVRFTHGAGTNNNIAFKVEDIDVPNVSSIADTAFYTTIIANRTAPAYIAYESANPVVTESPANGVYFHYVDITKWAQQSYYEGKDYVYLAVGSWNSTTNMYATTATDDAYEIPKYYPCYWYSFEDVEAPAPLENTAEAMQALGNETLIPAANAYKSAGGTTSAVTSANWVSTYISGNGNMAIVKVDLPEIPVGKTIGNFAFRYGVSGTSSNLRVFKMPGTDWNLSGSIADTKWYKDVIVASTSTAYNANDDSIVYTAGVNGSTDYTNAYANITSYIKECYAAGQTYCYLAYGDWNSTRNTGNPTTYDSSYKAAGVKPLIYYSFADIGALELSASTAEAGSVSNATTATFTFNNKLASATATVNGENINCTIAGCNVSFDLGDTGKKTVVVTATDTARNTITTEAITFMAGWENNTKVDDYNTKQVNASGATDAKYNPRVNNSESTVMRIKLPSIEEGKTIKEFGIKFLSGERRYPTSFRLFKIPFDGAVCANLIQTSGETPDGKINIQVYKTGAYDEYKANLGEFEYGGTTAKNDHVHYADITKYVKECYERGQTTMLIGFTANDSQSMVGIGDGDLDTAKRYHYIYWTTEDTDFSAKAPKFVASDDANTFAAATGLASLAKSSEYKFITSLANFGAEDASVTLYIAQYADGELIGITPKTVTVTANGTAADFTSANFTVDALAENVKAFIWNDAEQKPMLIGDVVVDAK